MLLTTNEIKNFSYRRNDASSFQQIDYWDLELGYNGPSDGSSFGNYSSTIKFYIHDSEIGTPIESDVTWVFELEGLEAREIYAERMSTDMQTFLVNQIEFIDQIIKPDFQKVETPGEAHIKIYHADLPGKLLGQADTGGHSISYTYDDGVQTTSVDFNPAIVTFDTIYSNNGYVAIPLNEYPDLNDITASVMIHEFLHVLGLGHPGGDGTSSWTDASETVMSYNWVPFGPSTPTLKITDQLAIAELWGLQELDVSNHQVGTSYNLAYIKDYDGNLHANTGSVSDTTKSAYKYQGLIDVNADGTKEAIYTNKESGRWVTGSINSLGEIDYEDHGQGGTTRVVGIYIDPLVTSGDVEQGSDHDSQRRFQNDLNIDNLTVKASGDYDGDGFQEVYWKTNDGTAYLRALMHADGNIQYANYQSKEQMSEYLTRNGNEGVIGDII